MRVLDKQKYQEATTGRAISGSAGDAGTDETLMVSGDSMHLDDQDESAQSSASAQVIGDSANESLPDRLRHGIDSYSSALGEMNKSQLNQGQQAGINESDLASQSCSASFNCFLETHPTSLVCVILTALFIGGILLRKRLAKTAGDRKRDGRGKYMAIELLEGNFDDDYSFGLEDNLDDDDSEYSGGDWQKNGTKGATQGYPEVFSTTDEELSLQEVNG